MLTSNIEINKQALTALPTRDAVLPVLAVLSNPNSVTAQVKTLPNIFTASDRIQDFTREDGLALIEKANAEPSFLLNKIYMQKATVANVNTVDGFRMTLSTGDVIHLRPLGNAPELRCYSEADSIEKANVLVVKVLAAIKP